MRHFPKTRGAFDTIDIYLSRHHYQVTTSHVNLRLYLKMGLKLKKPTDVAGASWPAVAVGLFVAFGGVLFGYDTGTISGILAMP